jgi:putative ABC transport system ATP-binding protein
MNPIQPLIQLEYIQKTYGEGRDETPVRALKEITLSIHKGEMVAIMGTSGSGKSTLMNILGMLDVPSSGKYLLDGHEIQASTGRELAELRNKYFGFVYQSFNLLKRTSVAKNVELPLVYSKHFKGNRKEKARELITQVGLEKRINHKPNQLSGGEQQRVAIARALVNDPDIILADEPTGNLDTKTSQEIMEIFTRLHEAGKTIILVTHEPDIAAYAKRLIVLKDGQIVSERNT